MKVGRCLLQKRLKDAKMTQQQLAEKTGISKQKISDYANNRIIMSLPTAKNIADAIGCFIDELYEWRKE
jgi:transcriptional regulator with XRE-family HTH domain